MALEDVVFDFSEDALRELASQAIKKGTGARALRSLIEKLMLDVMYERPSRDDVAAIKITAAVVRGEAKPFLRRKSDSSA